MRFWIIKTAKEDLEKQANRYNLLSFFLFVYALPLHLNIEKKLKKSLFAELKVQSDTYLV